jgi:hypothetical protein
MIKILTKQHIPQIIELIHSTDTLMGQSNHEIITNTIDSRKTLLTDSIVNFFTRSDNPYAVAFGQFEDNNLRAIICSTFSYMIPAWHNQYVISNYNNAFGGIVGINLIKEVTKYAESRGYYQYYNMIEKDRFHTWDKLFKLKMKSNYLTAIDEIVPAGKRPVNDLFWGWLYESRCKTVDTVVVNHWLPREYRTFIPS